MHLQFPDRYKPLLVVAAFIGVAMAVYSGNFVFTEPTPDCCATEWDPTPYQQVPAGMQR